MHCLHKCHSLSTRYKSTYADQTCKSCLLATKAINKTAYDQQISRQSTQRRTNSLKEGSSIKNLSLNPITDPVSNYMTPGREVTTNCYKPHTSLINANTDIRPSEHEAFAKHMSNPTEELITSCKSPWEHLEDDLSDELDNKCKIADEKPTYQKSIIEEQIKDRKFAKDLLSDKERLNRMASQQFYKTTTQRLYEGVDWKRICRKSTYPISSLPHQHDMSDLNHQIKRFNTEDNILQRIDISEWDRVQTRNGYFVKRPIAFTTISKNVEQIPSYSGMTGGKGEKDIENEKFTRLTLQRTTQPKYQETSRTPYIPGYGGRTHYLNTNDVLQNERMPRLETTARAHSGFNTYPLNLSKFNHKGRMSNTVSLINPFNPYNQVKYPVNRTASSNRIY